MIYMYVLTQTCGKDTITYLHDICIINIAILPYYVYRLYHRLTGYVYIEPYGESVDRSKTRKSYTREYKLEVLYVSFAITIYTRRPNDSHSTQRQLDAGLLMKRRYNRVRKYPSE